MLEEVGTTKYTVRDKTRKEHWNMVSQCLLAFSEVLPDVTESNCTSSGHYSCAVCRRDFSGINSLRKHMPLHARKVQHSCVSCGHVFGKRDYLLDHIRSKHNSNNDSSVEAKKTGEVFSQVCDVCSAGFHSVDKLKEHQRLHINWASNGAAHPVMPFRCHICK